MKRVIAISDSGRRVGEDAPGAKLTDEEVERIRAMHDDGVSYKNLARMFEISKSMVQAICQYKRRAVVVTRWKTVHTSLD